MMRRSLREAFGLASKTKLHFDHSSITLAELMKRSAYLVERIPCIQAGAARDALLDELTSLVDELWNRDETLASEVEPQVLGLM